MISMICVIQAKVPEKAVSKHEVTDPRSVVQ